MTEAHIKEATKMLGWFFDRCGKVPHYKGMMYVKNADNLKVLLDSVVGRIEKENLQRYISRTEVISLLWLLIQW